MQIDCFPHAGTDWKKVPVQTLAAVNPPYSLVKGQEYPFIEMASVGEYFAGIKHLDRRKFEGSGLSRFKVGDTLFAKITPCPENGKVAFVDTLPDEVGLGSTEFIVLSPRPGTDPRFLFHLLCSHDLRMRAVARMEGSTGRQRVPEDVFTKRLLVPEPSPNEQTAIARVLDAVDAGLERTRAAVERAHVLRKSIIHELLVHGVTKEKSRRSPAGRIPKSWRCEPLGREISDGPTNGVYRPESDYGEQGTRIVRIDDFANGRILQPNSLRRVNVEPVVQQRYALAKDDVLINRVNSLSHIGKTALVLALEEPTMFESNIMRVRCGPRLLPAFLTLVLCSDLARRHWLSRAKPAVNQASVNQRDVRELPMPLPRIDEQKEIVRLVSAADSIIDTQFAACQALRLLKRSLTYSFLTGRISLQALPNVAAA